MTKPLQPELSARFAGCGGIRNRVFCLVFLCVWALLLAADWGLRFQHYRWQDAWWIRTGGGGNAAAAAGGKPAETVQAARRGGDLSDFFPFRFLAAPYEEFHPRAVFPCDENGFPNEWPSAARHYGAMFAGDSFMVSSGTQNIAQVFAETSGLETCNFGRRASGPLQQIGWFIQTRPLRELPPLAFWGVTARDLGGGLFSRQPLDAWFAGAREAATAGAPALSRGWRIRREALRPREVDRAWPNTSALAHFARRAWGAVRMVLFRQWPPEIAAAEHPVFGPMLFYGENLKVLPALTPEQDAEGILRTVGRISEWFAEHGTALVVLLIPEKEQIHEDLLPAETGRGIENGADALVSALAAGLPAQGVHAVNLLPAFRQAAAEGTCLYWRDDTHWNDAGIRLAAREAWKYVVERHLADGVAARSAGNAAE